MLTNQVAYSGLFVMKLMPTSLSLTSITRKGSMELVKKTGVFLPICSELMLKNQPPRVLPKESMYCIRCQMGEVRIG